MSDFWDALYSNMFKQQEGGRIAGGRPVDTDYAPNHDESDIAPISIAKSTGRLRVDASGDITNPLPVQQADLNADIDEVSIFEGAISIRVDQVSSSLVYLGEAAIGSGESSLVWRVRKIDLNNPISIKWAGTGIFDQSWTNRASLTYT